MNADDMITTTVFAIEQRIADVRRETREATIRECAAIMRNGGFPGAACTLEDLLTPPSAPAEPELKCKVCGEREIDQVHRGYVSNKYRAHDFEPEEPGHDQ